MFGVFSWRPLKMCLLVLLQRGSRFDVERNTTQGNQLPLGVHNQHPKTFAENLSIFNMGRRLKKKVMSMSKLRQDHWLQLLTYNNWSVFISASVCLSDTEFCMWHVWQLAYDWSQYEGSTQKFGIPLRLITGFRIGNRFHH